LRDSTFSGFDTKILNVSKLVRSRHQHMQCIR